MDLITFIIILSILIVVHEWGHFITAKSLGIKVEKFSVGFGKKLYSRVHDGTEFMICAIPLGGFVKMAGDERAECKGAKEEFFSHPVGHRALVVLMGPLVNYVFAYICLYLIFIIGFPMIAPKVGKVMENFPAESADVRPGDKILKIDQRPMESFDDIQHYVLYSKKDSLEFVIERGDEQLVKSIVPRKKTMTNIFGQEEHVSLVGIQPQEEVIFLKYGLGIASLKAGEHLWKITTMTFKALYHVVTGSMPAKDALAGPVRIFEVIKEAVTRGISYVIFITAIISASLAIFNLFPIPVLDGGHLLFMGLEKVRGKPLPLKIEEGLTKVGISMLLCLMVFVVYNDIVQVGWFDSLQNFWQKIRTGSS